MALILDNLRGLASQDKWNEFRVSANPRQLSAFSAVDVLRPVKNAVRYGDLLTERETFVEF